MITIGWVEVDNSLYRKFEFADFAAAFAFMTMVAAIAEAQDHHPDWSNSYNVVEIRLRSHDAGRAVTLTIVSNTIEIIAEVLKKEDS